MDGSNEELFSDTSFAEHQDCRVGRCHLFNAVQHLRQRFTCAHNLFEVVVQLYLVLQIRVLGLQLVSDQVQPLDCLLVQASNSQ